MQFARWQSPGRLANIVTGRIDCSIEGAEIGYVPFYRWRAWLAQRLGPSVGLAVTLTIVSIALRLGIGHWIGVAGLVVFLPFIFTIAFLTGPVLGYFALGTDAAAIWFFILKPTFSFGPPPIGPLVDLGLLLIAGIGLIEFVRLLAAALDGLERERNQSQLLLQELHHRSGNAFQVVSSMLAMLRRTIPDPDAKQVLFDAGERVAALGVVQRHFLASATGSVDLGQLLPEVLGEFERQLGVSIAYREKGPLLVSAAVASTLALIAYELVANAAVHGRKDGAAPSVEVYFEPRGTGRAALIVEDDGPGLPVEVDPAKQPSVGFSIIRTFAASLMGAFDIRNNVGGKGVRAAAEFSLT